MRKMNDGVGKNLKWYHDDHADDFQKRGKKIHYNRN